MHEAFIATGVVVAGLAILWMVWPARYVAWLQAMTQKMPPAMQAGANRWRSPFSSSKPWYPTFLRIVGILIWVILLWLAYMIYKARP
jgi:hypothetical protein